MGLESADHGIDFAYQSAVEITRGMKRLSMMDRSRKNN